MIKHFVIFDFAEDSVEVLRKSFSFTDPFIPSFSLIPELHFSLLYLTAKFHSDASFTQHISFKAEGLKPQKIQVSKFRFERGYLILDAVRSQSLKSLHETLSCGLPKDIVCENRYFNLWDPHFGVARIGDEAHFQQNQVRFEKTIEQLSATPLFLDRLNITRRYNGKFETIKSIELK